MLKPKKDILAVRGLLTLGQLLGISFAIACVLNQLQLFRSALSPCDEHGLGTQPATRPDSAASLGEIGATNNPAIAGATTTATSLAIGNKEDSKNMTDEILNDATFYERHAIVGTTGEQILVGHYLFPTQALLQTAARNFHENNQRAQEKLLPLNDRQKELLKDDQIIPDVERKRCERYGLPYDPSRTERRRIFYGATLADDSFFLLQTLATEGYNLYHTASFVESNMTHTRSPRDVRFGPHSDNLKILQTMFGPDTKTSVEYFAPLSKEDLPDHKELGSGAGKFDVQHTHRQAILERWKRNGMRPDDLGILADADELFSRDFLRAVQICDMPALRPNQSCKDPKIVATTLIYEASPECIVSNDKIWHPDVILGECLEGIGDPFIHKPAERVFHGRHSFRSIGYGKPPGNYTGFLAQYPEVNAQTIPMYPLWNGADFRNLVGGGQVRLNAKSVGHNAYHFHNFFGSTEEIRHKYTTYGEPLLIAGESPLGIIHDDLSLTVACAHGWQNLGARKYYVGGDRTLFGNSTRSAYAAEGPQRPIFFENDDIRRNRHKHLKELISIDEKKYGAGNATCIGAHCKSDKK